MEKQEKYKTHKNVSPYLARVRSHKKPYFHKILGKDIIIYPNVMSPKYDWSSEFYVKNIPSQKGRSVLDIGCGTGTFGLFAYFKGAKKVLGIDINKNAIKNTKENFKIHRVKGISKYSNIFSKVKGKFDTILFNAPYHKNSPKDILEYGVFDYNYKTLRIFMKNAKKYLKKNGQIIFGFSSTGDNELLNKLIIENKFIVKKKIEQTKNGWTAYFFILKPIKFKSKMQEYIYEDDYRIFKEIKSLLIKGKNLKVGTGLGYASYFISLYNKNLINLEIQKQETNGFGLNIRLYEGKIIPYPNNYFDTVVCSYTLHHAKNKFILLSELIRVAKKSIVIVEETQKGLKSYLSLLYQDWKVNFKAKQKAGIILGNYYREKELQEIADYKKLKLIKHINENRKAFKKELFIFRK